MKHDLTVMVMGVGGNVSQGILKALALGLYTVDRAYVTPLAKDPAFVDWIVATCRAEGVQVDFLRRRAGPGHSGAAR